MVAVEFESCSQIPISVEAHWWGGECAEVLPRVEGCVSRCLLPPGTRFPVIPFSDLGLTKSFTLTWAQPGTVIYLLELPAEF